MPATSPLPGRTVVVLGDVMTDVIARHVDPIAWGSDTPAHVMHSSGGAGANVAHWLAHLGTPVTLWAAVGNDAPGHSAVSLLTTAGVDVRANVVAGVSTGCLVALVDADGERTFLADQGANAHLTSHRITADVGHVHISGYVVHAASNRDVVADAIAGARRMGARVSVDPASAAPLTRMGADAFFDAVKGVDLVIATLNEARVLVGTDDPDDACDALAARFPEVVMKLGPVGARYRGLDVDVRLPRPAPPGPVVNTTGAGDAFTAGLLAARSRGEDPRDALAAAMDAGARVVTLTGARPPGRRA